MSDDTDCASGGAAGVSACTVDPAGATGAMDCVTGSARFVVPVNKSDCTAGTAGTPDPAGATGAMGCTTDCAAVGAADDTTDAASCAASGVAGSSLLSICIE